jgi:hypothetical protein
MANRPTRKPIKRESAPAALWRATVPIETVLKTPPKVTKCPQGCGPHPPRDASVFINPDGSAFWSTPLGKKTCPAVIEVWTNVHLRFPDFDRCDENFDFSDMVQTAYDRVAGYIDDYTCPHGCPFKEYYRLPEVAMHVDRVCGPTAAGGIIYSVHLRGYFVCTDYQI